MNNNNQKITTRFAPSPTGLLHLGNYRTALFCYLFAKKHDGKFILRIEDTDTARSKKEYEEDIIKSLAWLNLPYDTFYRQSDHVVRHRECLQQLIDQDKAYISKETPVDPGDRTEVIRFRNPNKPVTFTDLIRGDVTFDTTELGDFVIAKSLTEPIFHLAVVVDDADEGVSHVMRGEDHLSNTARHILIQQALGFTTPIYGHVPLVLAPDRTKLSKRRGAQSVTAYQAEGYLPEAVINFMALLGWNPGTDQEIFSLKELTEVFDFTKVQKGGAIFNVDKLNWFNREYIKQMPRADQLAMVKNYLPSTITGAKTFTEQALERALPSIIERINNFHDVATQAAFGEFDCFFMAPHYAKALLKNQDHFEEIINRIEGLSEANFTKEIIKNAIWDYAVEKGKGEVLWPMRIALSGKEKSPDPFTIAEIVGKTETLSRLQYAARLE